MSPSNGVVVKGTSDLVYTPNQGFCGRDTFTYTLSNANGSSTATVTIDVACVNAVSSTGSPSTASDESAPPTRSPTLVIEEIANVVLNLEDDYVEGDMNQPIEIPLIVNDTIPGDGKFFASVISRFEDSVTLPMHIS